MGRSPCCDKVGLKKGPWTPEEDQKLLAYVQQHGHGSWRALPSKAGLQRCGKSCRLRWINYLRPDIKRGKFSLQEEQTIIQLHALLGNRWSAIAAHLSKRTDNEIKNYWNTHLKKRLIKMGIDPVSHKPKNDTLLSNDGCLKSTANLSHMAQWESARLEAEARLVKESKIRSTVCSLISASGPPPMYLKEAWSSGIIGNTSGDSESSASTTKLNELVAGGNNSLGLCNNEDYRDGENVIELAIPAIDDNTWRTTQQLQSSKHVANDDFLEHFTDLLPCSSNLSNHCSITSEDDPTINLVCCDELNEPMENIKDDSCQDKNKNYWDTILNLPNTSPSSNSLLF